MSQRRVSIRCQGAMISALLLLVSGCGGREPFSCTMIVMGTYATVTIVPDTRAARDAAAEVFVLLQQRQQQLNYYDPGSELSRLNAAAGQSPVTVPEPLATLISRALAYSRMTDGAFDVTATSLKQPQGFRNILWDEASRSVRIADPQARIDLGGITVGYVLDEAAALLRQRGQNNFLIDIGGDIYAGGCNPAGKPWRAGIRDPLRQDMIIDNIALQDQAVTTSGNYVQSHIIDPRTSAPVTGRELSVTVVAPQAIDADALATAFFVMGIEKTREFLKTRPDLQALFVLQENGIVRLERIK